MKSNFQGQVILITGASRGIGRDTALAFAKHRAKLVLVARSAEALREVGQQAGAMGAESCCLPTDISDPNAVAQMVEGALERFGRIDVLVNNAGIARVGPVESPNFKDDLQETLQASLFGMIHVTQSVLPTFRKQGSGTIINMSSVMGRKAFARFGSYAMVMHAVAAFTDALRQELAGTRIRVSVVHPALTATELLRNADEAQMPPPFRHMTPLRSADVGEAIVATARRGTPRVVLPRMANMLLLAEAIAPRFGDAVAFALTIRWIAWLLGMSRGTTYHQTMRGAQILSNGRIFPANKR